MFYQSKFRETIKLIFLILYHLAQRPLPQTLILIYIFALDD